MWFLCLFGLILFTSCASTVSRKEFDLILQQKIPLGNTIRGKAYYTGYDASWHYYYLELPFSWDRRYKIAKSDDCVQNDFPYTNDVNNWRLVYPRPIHALDIPALYDLDWLLSPFPRNMVPINQVPEFPQDFQKGPQ
jgi:hypothetical protein